jgi:hypothetical protein
MGNPAEAAMRAGFSPLGLFVACERGVRAAMFIRPRAVSPWDYGCV